LNIKIGIGYDVHRLVQNRDLIIGGVKLDYHLGLLGHSDADVLIHAIMDALLGAAGSGDIGVLFPDTDAKYKNINSLVLLNEVNNVILDRGYHIVNIDSVIIAQNPKMRPYIPDMIKNIADTLKITPEQINIKATTEEGLGFTGSSEGIAAKAVCLIGE